MAVWVVRAGKDGIWEAFNQEHQVATISWSEIPDLTSITSREEIAARYKEAHPDAKPMTIANAAGQIFAFRTRIHKDDLIALPRSGKPDILFGTVTGPYAYRPDFPIEIRHSLSVSWQKLMPRLTFDQDLLYSMGSVLTVFQVQRNEAEKRIRAVVDYYQTEQPSPPPTSTIPPPPADQLEVPKIFISHSHHDNDIARKLAADLELAGADVWIDIEDITAGAFISRINQALQECQWVIPVLSPEALHSRAVHLEINAALGLYMQRRMKGIIPFIVTPIDERRIPPMWTPFQRYDIAHGGYEHALKKLSKALHLDA